MESSGDRVHPLLDERWRYKPEDPSLRGVLLETVRSADGRFESTFTPRRPLPDEEFWFETTWNEYLRGEIYR